MFLKSKQLFIIGGSLLERLQEKIWLLQIKAKETCK